jgi:hypothetical protein
MNATGQGRGLGCAGCALNRRRFLGACAAGAGGLATLGARGAEGEAAPAAKPKVRLVWAYVPSTGPIWPNIGYDFEKRKAQLAEPLTQGCPNIEFLPITVHNRDQAQKMMDEDKDKGVDGYLVYILGLWPGVTHVVGPSGKPTLFVDDLYGGSGEFLTAYSAARRNHWKVSGVSSSRIEDVVEAAKCFELLKKPGATADTFVAACDELRKRRTPAMGDMTCKEDAVKTASLDECLKKLKESTILTVGGGWGMPGMGKAIEEVFGPKVIPIEFQELHAAYVKADKAEGAKWADTWMKAAAKVIEPKQDEIERSGCMYLAMKEIMAKHNAQAITINCLGGFYGGHIKAYPCLGFCQFNNDGLVGACEGDLPSTITMLAMGYLVGRPGFISDPVIDTSKNQIIYAHCVAPTKVFGPQGASNPYHIRSHSEDRKGAVLRSLMPLGYLTTTIECQPGRKELLFHQGKSADNIDEDKACRSKLAAEVKGDMEKLLGEWDRWGWHRVTFYGDLKTQVQDLAKALGLKFIEEA